MTNWRERIEEIVNDASGKLSNEEWVEKYGDVKYYELIESLIRQAQAEAWEEGRIAGSDGYMDRGVGIVSTKKEYNPYLESEE